MKNIFYYFFSIFFFSSIVYANELDEELIDKKFNQIKTTEFCTTNEWNEIEKKDFIAAFIFGLNLSSSINLRTESSKQRLLLDEYSCNCFIVVSPKPLRGVFKILSNAKSSNF